MLFVKSYGRVMSTFTKAIKDLDKLRKAHIKKSHKLSRVASRIEFRADAHKNESTRADKMMRKLEEFMDV